VRFIDANVFIRYLTQDDPAKAVASGALVRRLADGIDEATSSESVIAEVFYVLTSRAQYGLQRADAASRVRPALSATGLRFASKDIVLRAIDIYAAYPQLDFEDALSVAHMEARGVDEIVSYDRGFDGVPGVMRVEP
jgi:predicted nucleic acid-binding protein